MYFFSVHFQSNRGFCVLRGYYFETLHWNLYDTGSGEERFLLNTRNDANHGNFGGTEPLQPGV